MNVAVKYSDGSFYPVWWIVDVIENVAVAPQGYDIMAIEAFNQYLADTTADRTAFMVQNIEIPKAKQDKKNEIDINTQAIIAKGFTFAGLNYSLSLTAQINWSNIPMLPDAAFPLQIQSQEGTIYHLELANRQNFYLTAVNAKNTPLQSGHLLKVQIDQLGTLEEIYNFIDNRI